MRMHDSAFRMVKIPLKEAKKMKNIYYALIFGVLLFATHAVFAKIFYTDGDIVDMKESEVREIG